MYEPRIVAPVMKKSGDLGVRLVGGNAVGIFIHSVEIDSVAYQVSFYVFICECTNQLPFFKLGMKLLDYDPHKVWILRRG